MAERFPQFVLERDGSGNLCWEGILEPSQGRQFRVTITYPSRYPYREPIARVEDPPIERGAPHLYRDFSLCVHRKQWNAETGTAASVVPLVASWLVAYVAWIETGETF